MADVIFNGTDSRKPLGLAEVSLTIGDVDSEHLTAAGVDVTGQGAHRHLGFEDIGRLARDRHLTLRRPGFHLHNLALPIEQLLAECGHRMAMVIAGLGQSGLLFTQSFSLSDDLRAECL